MLDHYACACAVYEPASVSFGSLRRVGRWLAWMWSSARLEALPLHRASAQSHYSPVEWARLDETLISDWLRGERWCDCCRENGVSIAGTFSSEQQKINNCQSLGFLSLWRRGTEDEFRGFAFARQQVQNFTGKTFLKDLIWAFVTLFAQMCLSSVDLNWFNHRNSCG